MWKNRKSLEQELAEIKLKLKMELAFLESTKKAIKEQNDRLKILDQKTTDN